MRLIFLVFRFIKIFNNKNLLLYIITKILNFLLSKIVKLYIMELIKLTKINNLITIKKSLNPYYI